MSPARLVFVLLFAALPLFLSTAAAGAPQVVFSPNTLNVMPSTGYSSPPVIVQEADGISSVDVDIVVPSDVTLDTAASGTGLACITPGSDTSLFFASWNVGTRTIAISCIIGPSGRVVESIVFTTAPGVGAEQFTLVKPADRGSWPVGTTFGTLALQPPLPPRTVSVTSSPATGVSIGFTTPEATGKASPQDAPFTVSYAEGAAGVQLTAPAQDGAANPRWFSRWKLDALDQPAGSLTVAFDIGSSDHTAEAVYADLVGDLDGDGDIDQADAHVILKALFSDIAQTAHMDVNQDGAVNLNDARWILRHTYAGAGG